MNDMEINYDKLVEKSLKYVVVEALKIAADEGLPGEHHFYITFKTNHPNARVSAHLLNQYPEEMTIVLQHQFANLMIGSTYFEVDLSFGGIPQTLRIPYDSISYFADPHAKFALSFGVSDEIFINTTEINTPEKDQSCTDNKKEKQEAIVVSIEEYKKKHA
ncbi:MAG: hypothetical protein E7018_00825 [Alphaproteobacteria bacterium]|nr:hypothetical protein [Alphaproteobacteria bacterium]